MPVTPNSSILDEPIDVPELGQERNWAESNLDSLPSYSTHSQNLQTQENLYGAKSLDNLSIISGSNFSSNERDPFDTTKYWPIANQSISSRPDYEIQQDFSLSNNSESQRYSSNTFTTVSSDSTQIYNNLTPNSRYSAQRTYGASSNPIYTNSLSAERNESNVVASLADMSLDDRISESLNLRSKNTNSENIYSNSGVYVDTASLASTSNAVNDRYKDIPIYSNFEINPAQQQFLFETKDYYTKLSTPVSAKNKNDYEKNIYVPKHGEEAEKLQNFSESVENSKNYSALKYQNVEYANYANYSNYGSNAASSSRAEASYDEVNDTASNFYSEIGESSRSVYGSSRQLNAGIYDEVYESSVPRPHRPAPPCPSKPK